MEKETTHRAGTTHVGAMASLGVTPNCGKKKKIMARTWSDWNPIRELLRAHFRKEGAVVGVGE
jgi:hypothetical protein